MLRTIRLRQLGVIEDAELSLVPGLNVITGETGAGKTMVVTGLGLLLGARADSALVRAGATAALIEGEVDVGDGHPAAERVVAAGGDVGDGLLLARSLTAEGRSRAHVGGRAAPVGVLTEIGRHLVAVHGQADQWRLRDPEQHRLLLDDYGGADLVAIRQEYEVTYASWRAARGLLAEWTSHAVERTREAQMLRSAVQEIEAVAPVDGEEEALAVEEARLAHADGLRVGAGTAHTALTGDDDGGADGTVTAVVDLLGAASSALAPVSPHDPTLQGLHDRLDELSYLAADLSTELASYAAGVDVDPVRLAHVQLRRATVSTLVRAYGTSTGDVLRWAAESAERLRDLDGSDERVEQIRGEVARAQARVGLLGSRLREARERAATGLAAQVTEELGHLAMGSARIEVVVLPRVVEGPVPLDTVEVHGVRCRPGPSGLEDVEIRLAANPGAVPRLVTRAASGGELSRVMLALELVCRRGQVPTYVFDEIDAGVGGSAALDLGARLARLAGTAQVLVVTHLGQVAAFADHHLVVDKSSDGTVTESGVRPVHGDQRVSEIARMLGGVSDSPAAQRHARALLEEHAPARVRRTSSDPHPERRLAAGDPSGPDLTGP